MMRRTPRRDLASYYQRRGYANFAPSAGFDAAITPVQAIPEARLSGFADELNAETGGADNAAPMARNVRRRTRRRRAQPPPGVGRKLDLLA